MIKNKSEILSTNVCRVTCKVFQGGRVMSNDVKQRKIILDLAITLDGFIEGKNGEVDWCIMDTDMEFTNFLNEIDTILYGRKSYDLWGQYIPQDEDSDNEKQIWKLVHSKEKYVFLRTQIDTDNKQYL